MTPANRRHENESAGQKRPAAADAGLVEEMNGLYREVWESLHNFFLPSMKLVSKERHGSKVTRRHDPPQTPCDRLLGSAHISEQTKARLRKERAAMDPFKRHEALEVRLRRVLDRALHSSRPTGSLRSAPDPANVGTAMVSPV